MIEPDRKNGNFVSETSQGAPVGFLIGFLGFIAFNYYFFDGWLNVTVWIKSLFFLSFVWMVAGFFIRRWHVSPRKKKFYFRSGEHSDRTFYSELEVEEMNLKQKKEPQKMLESVDGVVFWRYKDRSWTSKEEAEPGEIKTAIEDFLHGN
jgi:hypothetical protein